MEGGGGADDGGDGGGGDVEGHTDDGGNKLNSVVIVGGWECLRRLGRCVCVWGGGVVKYTD